MLRSFARMRQTTAFAYGARVLLCPHCGAPLGVPADGGHARCRYCGAVSVVGAHAPERRAVVRAPELREADRIELLRSQTSARIRAPDRVAAWVDANMDLRPECLQSALSGSGLVGTRCAARAHHSSRSVRFSMIRSTRP